MYPWRYLLDKTSKLILRSIDIEIPVDRRRIRGISHCLGFDADSAVVIRVYPE
jgi:hypothetical protein